MLQCGPSLRTFVHLAAFLLAETSVCGTFRTLAANARMAGSDGLQQTYAVAISSFAASELKLR